MPPLIKKQKLQSTPSQVDTPTRIQRDLVSTLPLELLAEILSSTTPKEVLALARCSRYFCTTLVENCCATFIWKKARRSCVPPVPDPTPNFTEPAYAAYIFDGGPCEQCGKHTDDFYKSFSLRLRICDNSECYKFWRVEKSSYYDSGNIAYREVMRWLPSIENTEQLPYFVYYRKAQFRQAVDEYMKAIDSENGQQSYHRLYRTGDIKKMKVMQLSKELLEWKLGRLRHRQDVWRSNAALTREVAEREGWNFWDLKNTSGCLALLNNKKRALDYATDLDFKLIKPEVEIEIAEMTKKRIRSAEEQAYAKRRELVALEYHRLESTNSAKDPVILPTLSIFRDQPVMKSLQNKQGLKPVDMVKKLKDPTIRSLLDDNLSAWREKMRNDFSAILGFKSYSIISDKTLHPVDRLTARFICSKCVRGAPGKRQQFPLDFKAACAHKCLYMNKKSKAKYHWSVEQFELDQKAIKVTRDLFILLKTSEEDQHSRQVSDMSGDRIRCKSCDGTIVMNFESMQRHSHRHQDMRIELFSAAQLEQIEFRPIEWGLCGNLMSMARSAPRKQGLRTYGCRHCIQYEALPEADHRLEGDEAGGHHEETVNDSEVTKPRKKKLMSFHGLRGHLFKCHGVSHVADEDFYRDEDDIASENRPTSSEQA